jgi:hypothetical protein
MKFILAGIVLLFIGCTSKDINQPNPSIQIQKQDANKAWRDLDKE